MASNPKYVRLANRLSRGMVIDLNTGWGIAGLDIKEYPEDPHAALFVKRQIDNGKLEPASRAEWEDVNDDSLINELAEQAREAGNGLQEAHVQRAARETRGELEAARSGRGRASEVEQEEEVEEEDDDLQSLSKLSKAELVELAEEAGVGTSGNKPDLVKRLEAAYAEDD